jgi:hypothetical protein
MTKKEMIVILAVLKEAYKDFQVTEAKIDLWFNLLGDLDFKIVQVAVKKLILESPFVPTISDIRKQAIEIMHPGIDATEAYGEVRKAIKEYGYDNAPGALQSMSPLTRKVCEYIGWQNICLSEEPSVIRGQFLRMYEQLREKEQKEMLLPEGLKKEILEIAENKKLALSKGSK